MHDAFRAKQAKVLHIEVPSELLANTFPSNMESEATNLEDPPKKKNLV